MGTRPANPPTNNTSMTLIRSTDDFIALDTETGGLDSTECALLSIAAAPSWEAPPFHCYILPVGRLEKKALEVNGYTPELWAAHGAVTPKTALFEFQRWLAPHRHARFEMAAHNAGFDLLFIDAIQARTGIDLELPKIWHCTKTKMKDAEEAGLYVPTVGRENKHHLDDLGRESGYWFDVEPRSTEHDALQDARCCKHGLLWLRSLQKKEGR